MKSLRLLRIADVPCNMKPLRIADVSQYEIIAKLAKKMITNGNQSLEV